MVCEGKQENHLGQDERHHDQPAHGALSAEAVARHGACGTKAERRRDQRRGEPDIKAVPGGRYENGVAGRVTVLEEGHGVYVLIETLGPISGAHFNPAVTLAMRLRDELDTAQAAAYIAVQTVAAIAGVILAPIFLKSLPRAA